MKEERKRKGGRCGEREEGRKEGEKRKKRKQIISL